MKSDNISRRLFSTLQSQLRAYESILSLYTIPSKGRAIVAAKTLDSHTTVIQEEPIAASSFLQGDPPHLACRHCLKPIPPSSSTTNNSSFCSTTCQTRADNEWSIIDRHCNFDALTSKAKQQSTKFPLLAARLATMMLQSQLQLQHHLPTTTPDSLYPTRGTVQDLNNLCFVNNIHNNNNNNNNNTTTEATILEEWRTMHHLLTQSLWPVTHTYPELASYINTHLDIGWYTWLMSRLHVNVFRIDIVAPLMMSALGGGGWGGFDRAALLKAATAAVDTGGDFSLYSNSGTPSESASPSSQQDSGTGVYALASMFNHSCDPNLDVLFPHNNSTLCLQTAREVMVGEELTISYIDAVGMSVGKRRQYLKFAYGFGCNCIRCQEEENERDNH